MSQAGFLATLSAGMWLFSVLTEIAALGQFIWRRLWLLLPLFSIYLIADIARSAVLWELGKSPNTRVYRAAWISTEPFAIALDLLVVLELYSSLYKAYPGIHRFARIVIGLSITISAVIAFGTLSLDLKHITWYVPDVQRLFLLKRTVSSVLAFLLAVTMAVFPRAQCAATLTQHGWLLTFLFMAKALGFFFADFGVNSDWISLPFLFVQSGLHLLWAFWLSSSTAVRPPRSAAEISRTNKWNRELLEATRWLVR